MFTTVFNTIYNSFSYFISLIYFVFSLHYVVLPLGLDVGLIGVGAYFWTRLKKPDPSNVMSIFGPEYGSKEADTNPDSIVQCIAHRGAGLDAPENTLEAFKYCVDRECNFVELDVRALKDGQLVLLHDKGLQRLSESIISDVTTVSWEDIKDIDIGVTHPNRQRFKVVKPCLLDEALDYLLANRVRVIIDVKGDNVEKPHPDYKCTIFNVNDDVPSKICLKPVSFESILNSCYVNIAINMTCFKYKRELMHNFKHTLVNHKLRRIKREPPLNPHLQCPKKMRIDSRLSFKDDIKEIIKKILRSNRYTMNVQPDIETLFQVIKEDLEVLMNDKITIDLPCAFRYYMSSYRYVRHLYQDVDTRSEKYDLRLEEKISPMLKFHIGRLNAYSSAVTTELAWLKMECTICSKVYLGVTGIEALKTHFSDCHQNEANWLCTHCDKEYEATELAAARWYHKCEDIEND